MKSEVEIHTALTAFVRTIEVSKATGHDKSSENFNVLVGASIALMWVLWGHAEIDRLLDWTHSQIAKIDLEDN